MSNQSDLEQEVPSVEFGAPYLWAVPRRFITFSDKPNYATRAQSGRWVVSNPLKYNASSGAFGERSTGWTTNFQKWDPGRGLFQRQTKYQRASKRLFKSCQSWDFTWEMSPFKVAFSFSRFLRRFSILSIVSFAFSKKREDEILVDEIRQPDSINQMFWLHEQDKENSSRHRDV